MQYKKPGIERFTVKPGKFRDKPAPESAFGEVLSGIQVIRKRRGVLHSDGAASCVGMGRWL